jgi:hypothetical protein
VSNEIVTDATPESKADVTLRDLAIEAAAAFRASGHPPSKRLSFLSGQFQVAASRNPELLLLRSRFLALAAAPNGGHGFIRGTR